MIQEKTIQNQSRRKAFVKAGKFVAPAIVTFSLGALKVQASSGGIVGALSASGEGTFPGGGATGGVFPGGGATGGVFPGRGHNIF